VGLMVLVCVGWWGEDKYFYWLKPQSSLRRMGKSSPKRTSGWGSKIYDLTTLLLVE